MLVQLTHRQATLSTLRNQRRPLSVQLPDLHAANLFLQAYATLQVAADGKLPRVTAVLNVEVFHTLCQNEELAAKVGVQSDALIFAAAAQSECMVSGSAVNGVS